MKIEQFTNEELLDELKERNLIKNIEDYSDKDIRNEAETRDLFEEKYVEEFETYELAEELEDRGYTVIPDDEFNNSYIIPSNIRQSNNDEFKRFICEVLNIGYCQFTKEEILNLIKERL